MTEQSIQEARAQLTAGEAARQLGPILINRKSDMTIEEEWTPKTVAALEWAIELLTAEQDGMLLHAKFPIGKIVYKLRKDVTDEVRIIDGERYTRQVFDWRVVFHKYEWIDAICDLKRPERQQLAHVKYFSTGEEACAERDRLNSGGGQDA